MSVKVCRLLLVGVALGMVAVSVAYADADEASLQVQAQGGLAFVGDDMAPVAMASAATTGLGIRATYATHDWFAWEADAGFERFLDALEYRPRAEDVENAQRDSNLRAGRASALVRAGVGAAARFGLPWTFTLHGSLGFQVRTGKGWIEEDGIVRNLGWSTRYEGVVTLMAGLEHRFDKTWVIGFGLLGRQAIRFDTAQYRAIGGMIHVSGYWYPWQDDE